MREFKSAYDFYALPEDERIGMIGTQFREKGRDGVYVVIGLDDKQFNYGIKQGLLYVSPIWPIKCGERAGQKMFKVGAFSPDDMDCDLEFWGPHASIRQEVLSYLLSKPLKGQEYYGLLARLRDHFKAGELY